MFEFIKKGKLLEQGVNLYQQKDFVKAIDVFNEVVAIDDKDFAANFWMARTQTMLGDYAVAKELLNKCRELKPKVIELLIVPWEALIHSLENDEKFAYEQLSQYDFEADNSLYKCYFKKQYSCKELFVISLIMLAGSIIWETQSHLGANFTILLIPVLQLCYFHFNTLLPLDLWFRCRWVKEQIELLIFNSSFLLLTIGFIIISAIVVGADFLLTAKSLQIEGTVIHEVVQELCQQMWTKVPSLLLAGPITGELTFSFVWYNYFAKYNKYWAYFGISLFIMLLQGGPIHFFTSMIYIWAYNKYKTIMAPMILHFAYNFFLLLQPQIYLILFF